MNTFVISVGSNYAQKKEQVEKALLWLKGITEKFKASSIYETPEIHGYGPSYFNAVARGETEIDYGSLNRILKEYELRNGRTPESRVRKEVVIDLDIVVWEDEIIRAKDYRCFFFRKGYLEINQVKE